MCKKTKEPKYISKTPSTLSITKLQLLLNYFGLLVKLKYGPSYQCVSVKVGIFKIYQTFADSLLTK